MRDQEQWDRISRHYFDGLEDVELPFHARLARDMGWSNSFALNAIGEYRRFIYLCCISEALLTPSEEVDEVWHLHRLYAELLGRVLPEGAATVAAPRPNKRWLRGS